jgi:hypothetical protein
MYLIFRKTNGELLYQAHSSKQAENEIAACLQNEGGVAEDYQTVEVTDDPNFIPIGHFATLVLGEVVVAELPEVTARNAARESGKSKLIALGLTTDEISAIVLS